MNYGHIRREDSPARIVPAHEPDSRVRTPPSQQERLQGGSIGTTLIEDGAITTGKIAVGAITAGTIETRSITADKMVLGTLTADEISTGAITADKIFAGAVTATKIATNAVTAIKIEAGAITTEKIFAGAVTAEKIFGKSITAAQIEAGTITADEMTVSQLSVITANIGEMEAGLLRNGDDTAGLLIGGAFALPGGWTRYLNLNATGAQPFLKFNDLEFRADGTKVWPGEVLNSAALISAEAAAEWNAGSTRSEYDVWWTVNGVANTTDHRIRISFYRDGVKVDEVAGVAINATQPYERNVSGGASTHKVYCIVSLTTTGGATLSSLETYEDDQML